MSQISTHPQSEATANNRAMATAVAQTPIDPDAGVLRAADGGRALVDRLGSLVFSYCRRKLADSGRAEEVAQDVFVAAWRSRDKFDPTRASLSTWVMGIARFKVMDAYRASNRTPLPVDDLAISGQSTSPADSPRGRRSR